MIGHIDGDESNGRKSNLRWECKRHNTIHGKAMAKAGKGVRTRQYNPRKKKRRNPGATNLAQYVQAAVDHTRKAHDAGGKIIHETPKAKRREFAREIAFRKRHNPEKEESKKLSHAAVKYEALSQHKGQACQSCAHFIAASPPRCEGVKSPISPRAWCKRYEPAAGADADALYKAFHGRGPDKILNLLVQGIDPYGAHPALTSLGPLIRLVVGDDVELSEQGEVIAASDVTELTFVPSMSEYRRITERLDPKDGQQLREFKAWLGKVGAPMVAAVPNARQLYFLGGKQELDNGALLKLGCDPEKDICDAGEVFLIEYFAQKRFDRFEPTTYFHQFGEKTDERPTLVYMRAPKLILLAGGGYVVKSVGIDN